jgi:hypothetical protein
VLTLNEAYDALAVLRKFPDGIVADSIFPVYFRITGIDVQGRRATGLIEPDASNENYAFDGDFDSNGDLLMPIGSATLTGTIGETVDELGGRAQDTTPEDGVADEIDGYLGTHLGMAISNGVFFAVAQQDVRPEEVDEARVSITLSSELGFVQVAGAAGAVIGRAGVEIFRFRLSQREPEFSLIQADGDGAFSAKLAGIEGDVYVLRTRVIGKASDARYFTVTR